MDKHRQGETPAPRLTVRPVANRAAWDRLWDWLLSPSGHKADLPADHEVEVHEVPEGEQHGH
jgi:hypothetical protein